MNRPDAENTEIREESVHNSRKTAISALKVMVFFLVAFLLLGRPFVWSLSLAILAGVATGWIIRGWHSKDLSPQQAISPELIQVDQTKIEKEISKRRQKRYNRQPEKSWFFWKNPRRPPFKRR
jgi:hypothetical protein